MCTRCLQMASSKPPIDRGWAWVTLASAGLMQIIGGAVTYSVGVFNILFLEHFRGNKATIAGVGSMVMGLQYLTGRRHHE